METFIVIVSTRLDDCIAGTEPTLRKAKVWANKLDPVEVVEKWGDLAGIDCGEPICIKIVHIGIAGLPVSVINYKSLALV